MPTSTTPDKWINYTGSDMPTCRCTKSLYTTLIICHNQGHQSRSHTLAQKRCFPPNKNADKQLRFFSTKKRKLTSTHLSKPSYTESQQCKSHLLSTDTTLCGVCLQGDDCSEDELVDLVQCSTCEMWIHLACAHCEISLDTYTCNYCNTNISCS